jgi:hypothetical protein
MRTWRSESYIAYNIEQKVKALLEQTVEKMWEGLRVLKDGAILCSA